MSLNRKIFAWGLDPVGSAESHYLLREFDLSPVVANVLDDAVAENDVEASILISTNIAGVTFNIGNVVM